MVCSTVLQLVYAVFVVSGAATDAHTHNNHGHHMVTVQDCYGVTCHDDHRPYCLIHHKEHDYLEGNCVDHHHCDLNHLCTGHLAYQHFCCCKDTNCVNNLKHGITAGVVSGGHTINHNNHGQHMVTVQDCYGVTCHTDHRPYCQIHHREHDYLEGYCVDEHHCSPSHTCTGHLPFHHFCCCKDTNCVNRLKQGMTAAAATHAHATQAHHTKAHATHVHHSLVPTTQAAKVTNTQATTTHALTSLAPTARASTTQPFTSKAASTQAKTTQTYSSQVSTTQTSPTHVPTTQTHSSQISTIQTSTTQVPYNQTYSSQGYSTQQSTSQMQTTQKNSSQKTNTQAHTTPTHSSKVSNTRVSTTQKHSSQVSTTQEPSTQTPSSQVAPTKTNSHISTTQTFAKAPTTQVLSSVQKVTINPPSSTVGSPPSSSTKSQFHVLSIKLTTLVGMGSTTGDVNSSGPGSVTSSTRSPISSIGPGTGDTISATGTAGSVTGFVTNSAGGFSSNSAVHDTSSSGTVTSSIGSTRDGMSSTAMSSTRPTSTPTTKTAAATTTPASVPIRCMLCSGPSFICEQLYHSQQCPDVSHQYCINELTNNRDGTRTLDRRCATKAECEKDWIKDTSNRTECTNYDVTAAYSNTFGCSYCCTTPLCNEKALTKDLYVGTGNQVRK